MKKGVAIVACLCLVLIISSSFVSAGFFSDLWNKITGKAVGECIDSDGGKNFFVRGIVSRDSIKGYLNYEDYCTSSTNLVEYHCYQGVVLSIEETCANGCVEGACVEKELEEVCSDGTLINMCSTTKLKYCTMTPESPAPKLIDNCMVCGCPEKFECQKNGACEYSLIEEEEEEPETVFEGSVPGCADSDATEEFPDGRNYYVSGRVSNGPVSAADSCSSEILSEKICIIDEQDLPQIRREDYSCPNGCEEGACVAGEIDPCFYSFDSPDYCDVESFGFCETSDCPVCDSCLVSCEEECAEQGENVEWCSPDSCHCTTSEICSSLPEGCGDGTPYDSCSELKPKYCEEGILIDDCQTCGCEDDYICQTGGTCVIDVPSIRVNEKAESLYEDGEVFLISDADWKNVLPFISAVIWTEESEIIKYPFLIYHDETYSNLYLNLESGSNEIFPYPYSTGPFSYLLNEKELSQSTNLKPGQSITFKFKLTTDYQVEGIQIYVPDFIECIDFENCLIEDIDSAFPDGEIFEILFKVKEDAESEVIQSFDADSILYFMQQYNPSKLTLIGETSQELDGNLIVGGLEQENIQRRRLNDYLFYWESFDTVVYVEDDYELALLASTYASLINAPLIIQGTTYDSARIFSGRNVICIGTTTLNGGSCSEQYNLEQLQDRYKSETNTDKIILVNPIDWSAFVSSSFKPEKSTELIHALYTKTSLNAPILASSKHELIVSTTDTDYLLIDSFIEPYLVGMNYLTIMADFYVIPHSDYQDGWALALDPSTYADITGDQKPDVAIGRIAGISNSDVSSYLARSIFYDEFEKANSMKFLASSFGGTLGAMTRKISSIFGEAGYNAIDVTSDEESFEFDSVEWENQDLIYYTDHGDSFWSGMSSDQIPELENSLVLSASCSTVSTSSYNSFWARAIRKGAIGYLGATGITAISSDYSDFMNKIYYSDISIIGEAFKESYDSSSSSRAMTILIGDPTLDVSPEYMLLEELPVENVDFGAFESLIDIIGIDTTLSMVDTLTNVVVEGGFCCLWGICETYGILQCQEELSCGDIDLIAGVCCDLTDPDSNCIAGEFCDDNLDNDDDGEIDEAECVCRNRDNHCGEGPTCEDCSESPLKWCGQRPGEPWIWDRVEVAGTACLFNECVSSTSLGTEVLEICDHYCSNGECTCDEGGTFVFGAASRCCSGAVNWAGICRPPCEENPDCPDIDKHCTEGNLFAYPQECNDGTCVKGAVPEKIQDCTRTCIPAAGVVEAHCEVVVTVPPPVTPPVPVNPPEPEPSICDPDCSTLGTENYCLDDNVYQSYYTCVDGTCTPQGRRDEVCDFGCSADRCIFGGSTCGACPEGYTESGHDRRCNPIAGDYESTYIEFLRYWTSLYRPAFREDYSRFYSGVPICARETCNNAWCTTGRTWTNTNWKMKFVEE
jgi:hypothetical protein